MQPPDTPEYYNALAPYYRYLFPDWEASIARQTEVLDGVIREFFGDEARDLLDAACGIGTQALGLAGRGYNVSGSDISPAAVGEAQREALVRGMPARFAVADMRDLGKTFDRQFDVVLACDNAIPHLLSNDEIRRAFREFYHFTVPEGGCIISVRDYAALDRGGTRFYPRTVHQTAHGRLVLFDIWEFDGDYYDFTTYLVEDEGEPVARAHAIRGGRYYCVTVETLERLMEEAGFSRVTTLRDRFYQPLLIGEKSPG